MGYLVLGAAANRDLLVAKVSPEGDRSIIRAAIPSAGTPERRLEGHEPAAGSASPQLSLPKTSCPPLDNGKATSRIATSPGMIVDQPKPWAPYSLPAIYTNPQLQTGIPQHLHARRQTGTPTEQGRAPASTHFASLGFAQPALKAPQEHP